MLIFQITFVMASWRILMLRHKTGSLHNSSIYFPTCLIFLMLHEGSVLNTCASLLRHTYSTPSGETVSPHNSYIYYPICAKLLRIDEGCILDTTMRPFCVMISRLVVKQEVIITPPYIIRFVRYFSCFMMVQS